MRNLRSLYSTTLSLCICLCLFFISLPVNGSQESALFAGGCFWCLEHDLEQLDGVISAESGYSGGSTLSPNYNNHKGHQESVMVLYDTDKINFDRLARNYFLNIDPLDDGGQFCDRGDSYRPVIFYKDYDQKEISLNNLQSASDALSIPLDAFKVEVKEASDFWKAEDYHQDYAKNNRLKYNFYRTSCGRDVRLKEIWGDSAGKDIPWEKVSSIIKKK